MSPICVQDITIQLKLLNTGNLLARATVILFGVWEEHGWKVMKSNRMHPQFGDEVWIQSPCYHASSKWEEMVYIGDKKLWEQVHEKIYDAYFMAKSKKLGQEAVDEVGKEKSDKPSESQNSKEEEVNPDDIPF